MTTKTPKDAPLTILERVAAIKGSAPDLVKSLHNKHGDYYFAGVDQIYEGIRPLMSKAGLDLRCEIVHCERFTSGKGSVWLDIHARLSFVCQGEAEEPMLRYLAIPMTGPQSYESAISYLCKQFLRHRFMLSTGDMDLDTTRQEQMTAPEPEDTPDYQITFDESGKISMSHEAPKRGTPARRLWDLAAFKSIKSTLASSDDPLMFWDRVDEKAKALLPEAGYNALVALVDRMTTDDAEAEARDASGQEDQQ